VASNEAENSLRTGARKAGDAPGTRSGTPTKEEQMPRFVYDAEQVRILQREGRVVPVSAVA
jgi:hypothetical protein